MSYRVLLNQAELEVWSSAAGLATGQIRLRLLKRLCGCLLCTVGAVTVAI